MYLHLLPLQVELHLQGIFCVQILLIKSIHVLHRHSSSRSTDSSPPPLILPQKPVVPKRPSKTSTSLSSKMSRRQAASSQRPSLPSPLSARPKRRAGRSLLERNPDWVQFAPEGKEGKRGAQRRKEKVVSGGEKEILRLDEDSLEVWKSERFRLEHRKMLEFALSQWSGWNSAIRTGSDMEKEVFKKAASQEEYLAGINRLVTQFKKRSSPSVKNNAIKPKSKEKMVKKEAEHQINLSNVVRQGKPTLAMSALASTSEVDSVSSGGKNTVIFFQSTF